MTSTASFSRGCFAFRPPNSGKRKRSRLDSRVYFEACAGHSTGERRYTTYRQTWSHVRHLCDTFQEHVFDSVFGDMIEFLKRSAAQPSDGLIPTAALIMGVNMPDHCGVFSALVRRIRDGVTSHVALLSSADCATVKAAVRCLAHQLVNPDKPNDGELDEDGELEGAQRVKAARIPTSLPALVHDHLGVARDHSDSDQERKRLVIVWRDLEALQPRVLQDLVLIFSSYTTTLSVSFVFGVATTAAVVHRLLPQNVSQRLSMEKFHSQLSTGHLSQVMEQVLLSDTVPFRLGGRTLRLLLDMFLYHDFSVSNFIAAYKFCMLEHYLSSPASVLCCQADDLVEAVAELTSEELQTLRQLGSVRKHLESLSPEQRQLFDSDKHLRSWLKQSVRQLGVRHSELLSALRCLFALTVRIPGAPLGKQFRELYNLALLHTLHERDEYANCMKLLHMLSRREMVLSLEAALLAVRDVSPNSPLGAELQRHLDSIASLDQQPAERHDDVNAAQMERELKRTTNRHQLREMLQTMGAEQNRRLNPYEALRSDVVSSLDSSIRALVTRPSIWPCHEVCFFDSVSSVRRRLVGAPRASIQTALSDPHRYLQCSCCELSDPSSIPASLPDVSIVYKLHLECGKLINLFDWLQAFQAVVGEQELDDTVQARFAHAVSELQFLGFVRPTQKKTDHVARLTWGTR